MANIKEVKKLINEMTDETMEGVTQNYYYHPGGVGDFLESPHSQDEGWIIVQGKSLEDAVNNLPEPERKNTLAKVEKLMQEEEAEDMQDLIELTCGQGLGFFIIEEEFWQDYLDAEE